MKNRSSRWTTLGLLLVTIVTSVFAAAIVTVVINNSLERYAQSLQGEESFVIFSEVKPEPVPGTYEEALERVQDAGWSAMASLKFASADASRASQWVTPEDALGVGVSVTSDGWLLFHEDAFAVSGYTPAVLEVWLGLERFEVEDVVRDSLTEFVLVKVDAQNRVSLAFGPSGQMQAGESVFALSGRSGLWVSALEDADNPIGSLIHPAESFATNWQLQDSLPTALPLLNSSGELIGFTSGSTQAIPMSHGETFVQTVLRDGEVQYAGLGAYVADVDRILNFDEEASHGARSGAYVSTVVHAESGLVAGDVILSIDGTDILDDVTIAELLVQYTPGDVATLRVLNAEGQQDVEVTFVTESDLVY